MTKKLADIELVVSWISDEYGPEWSGRRCHVDLDAIASSVVSVLLPKLAEQAPSLDDVLDALAKLLRRKAAKSKKLTESEEPWLETAQLIEEAAEAATDLLAQCSLFDYGLDDSVDNLTALLENVNERRATIHDALKGVIDAYKQNRSS